MPNVPHQTRSRASHRFNRRTSHDYDAAFRYVTDPGYNAAIQEAVDGVTMPGGVSPGTLAKGAFVAAVQPPEIVDERPVLPDPFFPIGSFIYYTVDQKLYRNVDDVDWTAAIEAVDLTGQIGSGQIEDDAITSDKIRANAIQAGHMDANSVTAGVIAAGAVSADALESDFVLANTLMTALSGQRVEFDIDGIRLYDSAEDLEVKIPTDGTGTYVRGEIKASVLTAVDNTTLNGDVTLAADSTTTLQNGVSTPTSPPTLTASVDYKTLLTAKSNLGSGIAYSGGKFYVAADPASGYVAHIYDASTGAYVAGVPSTGSTATYTTTYGNTSHIADTTDAYGGTTNSQIATPLVMPRDGRITKVSAYFAGYTSSCTGQVAVWNTSGTSLAHSADFTVSGKTFSNGNDTHYNKDLTTNPAVSSGTTIWAGFLHAGTDTFFYSKDDGSGKTTKGGNGNRGDMVSPSTIDSAGKPNVYITYEYDVDTRLETSPMIGIAVDGTYIYTLDELGQVWSYDIATPYANVTKTDVAASIHGTEANAGLFWDATDSKLVCTNATGSTGTDHVEFTTFTVSGGALTYSAQWHDTSLSVNGLANVFRGGCRVADALNGGTDAYWVPISGTIYAFSGIGTTGANNTANRDFGTSATCLSGLTHDGTNFRGWAIASNTKVWTYSTFDWTTGGTTWWLGYAWYDSTGLVETPVGPTTSATVLRHQRLAVQTDAVPGGSADRVRVYAYHGASDVAAGSRWLQSTDAGTSRYMTAYAVATHDQTVNGFSGGGTAVLQSGTGGLIIRGSGYINRVGTSFPSGNVTGDHYFRSDLGMEFFYDGTRWLSTQQYVMTSGPYAASATYAQVLSSTGSSVFRFPVTNVNGLAIRLDDFRWQMYVNSGGSALSASHSWAADLKGITSANAASSALATLTLDSGANSTWHDKSAQSGSIITTTYYQHLRLDVTKTGTPGTLNITSPAVITYRLIAT